MSESRYGPLKSPAGHSIHQYRCACGGGRRVEGFIFRFEVVPQYINQPEMPSKFAN